MIASSCKHFVLWNLQAELAEQREAAAAAELRASVATEEAAALRSRLDAERVAPPKPQHADDAPVPHAASNGHVDNGAAVAPEEQVTDYTPACRPYGTCDMSTLRLTECLCTRPAMTLTRILVITPRPDLSPA